MIANFHVAHLPKLAFSRYIVVERPKKKTSPLPTWNSRTECNCTYSNIDATLQPIRLCVLYTRHPWSLNALCDPTWRPSTGSEADLESPSGMVGCLWPVGCKPDLVRWFQTSTPVHSDQTAGMVRPGDVHFFQDHRHPLYFIPQPFNGPNGPKGL